MVVSTFYIDHAAWRSGHDLQYCLSAVASKVLKALKYSQTSDWNANSLRLTFHQKWDNTSDLHQTLSVECVFSLLNTGALMPVLKWTAFRMVCKFHLEGRGNSDQRRVQDMFQEGESRHLFTEAPPPAIWLMPTVPNDWCQKSWCLYIQRRGKSLYQRITVRLTNLLRYELLPMFAAQNLTGPILSYNLFLHGVSFTTLSKPSSFIRKCYALCFGEELLKLMFLSSPPETPSFTVPRERSQWGYGLRGICVCREQEKKVFFTGWGIQGGSSMMSGWTRVWGRCTRIWNCQSVQTCFNTQCEINLWEILAADILPR
jgi:hypothetical protein